jgi:Ca2+-binding RTX toxin-like protein
VLDPAVLAGTGITLTQVSATRIDLSGNSLIENYEAVISAATIEIDLEAGRVGDRTIAVTVQDPDGNTGSATTTFTVDDNLLTGPGDGSGDDIIVGTSVSDPDSDGDDVISGRGGDDRIDGRSGDDFIDGGDGKDTIIVGGPGNNIISGGPQPDEIILSTGPGVDLVRITGLSDGKDTIRNFNATQGDRLDLSLLFRDSEIDDASFDHFVRTTQDGKDFLVQVDLDGQGTDHRFVDIARLVGPTGVTAATDPSSFIITSDSDAQVA